MTQATAAIDGKHFRSALGSFATGVTIVTTRDDDGNDVGLTANSFNSVSLDPPMVLWSLAKSSGSLQAFLANEHFAVHVLAVDQQPLSDKFARRGADKFEGQNVTRGVGGVPLLEGSSARFQCRTAFRYEGGDHMIFVGEVQAFDHFEKAPLLFHGGKYAKVLPRATPEANTGGEVESSFRKDFLGYLLGFASVQLHRPVRARCAELGISDAGYYVLTLLIAQPDLSAAQVTRMLSINGDGLTAELEATMIDAGLIAATETHGERKFHLTDKGRHVAIEIFAVAKAAESTAERALDFDEATLLKDLLKRVIRSTLEPAGSPGATR